jgi:hypothetical protein
MKKVFKTIFFIALSLTVLFVAAVCISVFFAGNIYSAGIGIIGGADGPTAILVTNTLIFGNPWFWIFCFVLVALIISAIGWIVTKNR